MNTHALEQKPYFFFERNEAPYRLVQDEAPYRLVQDEALYRLVQDEVKSRSKP